MGNILAFPDEYEREERLMKKQFDGLKDFWAHYCKDKPSCFDRIWIKKGARCESCGLYENGTEHAGG